MYKIAFTFSLLNTKTNIKQHEIPSQVNYLLKDSNALYTGFLHKLLFCCLQAAATVNETKANYLSSMRA